MPYVVCHLPSTKKKCRNIYTIPYMDRIRHGIFKGEESMENPLSIFPFQPIHMSKPNRADSTGRKPLSHGWRDSIDSPIISSILIFQVSSLLIPNRNNPMKNRSKSYEISVDFPREIPWNFPRRKSVSCQSMPPEMHSHKASVATPRLAKYLWEFEHFGDEKICKP